MVGCFGAVHAPYRDRTAQSRGKQSPQTRYDVSSYCGCSDRERLMRFTGCTRMRPPRGLSMSAIRKNEIDTISVRTRNTTEPASVRWILKPISRLQQRAIASIKAHAATGIRFHHAACVYPCEFNTSFMPETTSAAKGVGCEAAGRRTVDHSSIWR
jgi:hypothetical protein